MAYSARFGCGCIYKCFATQKFLMKFSKRNLMVPKSVIYYDAKTGIIVSHAVPILKAKTPIGWKLGKVKS